MRRISRLRILLFSVLPVSVAANTMFEVDAQLVDQYLNLATNNMKML